MKSSEQGTTAFQHEHPASPRRPCLKCLIDTFNESQQRRAKKNKEDDEET